MLSSSTRRALQAEVNDLEKQKLEVDNQLELLHKLLGGAVAKKRGPKAKGTDSVIKSGKKRSKRTPEQLQNWAAGILHHIKAAKEPVGKAEVQKATGETLANTWPKDVEKYSGEKLKKIGNGRWAKYTIK